MTDVVGVASFYDLRVTPSQGAARFRAADGSSVDMVPCTIVGSSRGLADGSSARFDAFAMAAPRLTFAMPPPARSIAGAMFAHAVRVQVTDGCV